MRSHLNFTVFGGHNLSLRLLSLSVVFLFLILIPANRAEAACTVPNSITNGQVADATKVMGNFNALKDCVDSAVSPTGTPVAGNLSTFSSPNSITSGNLSGDCTTAGTLTVSCTKANGTSFGAFATGTDAGQLTGTIPVSRFNNGSNASSSTFLRGDGVWASPPGGGGGSGGANWWSGQAPLASAFPTAFTGAGSDASLADDADIGLVIKANNVGSGTFTTRGWGKAVPSGSWSVKARVTANIYNANFAGGGLYVFESGTSKQASAALIFDGTLYADTINGSLTAFIGRGSRYPSGPVLWARIDYDGSTNYTFFISNDGKNWLRTRVVAKSTLFTSAATHVGLGVTIQNNPTDSANQGVACDYWVQSW